MQNELDELKKEYQEYAYIGSHDMGAPLRQMRGFLKLLFDSLDVLDEDQMLYKRMILQSLSEGDELLKGLLKFSRIGEHETDIVAIDFLEFIKDFNDAEVSVISHSDEPLNADRVLLSKIISELLENANKFKSEDRGLSITMRYDRDIISISDNGIGLLPDLHERALGPMRQMHPKGQYEGCGMGLALCQKMMKMQGGKLDIQSNDDHGITINLYFLNR